MSRDELFLLRLSEWGEKPVNFLTFAKRIGFREAETVNIVKLLAKANLVLKIDDETIQITPRGSQLADTLGNK
jgi:hypothetical protein